MPELLIALQLFRYTLMLFFFFLNEPIKWKQQHKRVKMFHLKDKHLILVLPVKIEMYLSMKVLITRKTLCTGFDYQCLHNTGCNCCSCSLTNELSCWVWWEVFYEKINSGSECENRSEGKSVIKSKTKTCKTAFKYDTWVNVISYFPLLLIISCTWRSVQPIVSTMSSYFLGCFHLLKKGNRFHRTAENEQKTDPPCIR